jgi:hypothetical protein
MHPHSLHTLPHRLFTTLILATTSVALAQPGGDLQPADQPLNPLDDPRGRPFYAPEVDLRPAPVTAVEFAQEPLIISQFGLKVRIPLDWSTEQTTTDIHEAEVVQLDPDHRHEHQWLNIALDPLGGSSQRIITLSAPDRFMGIRIHTPAADDPSSPLDVLAQVLAQKVVDAAAASAGAPAEAYAVFEKDPALNLSDRAAYRFYMRIPRGVRETGLVLAYTLLDLPGAHFLVLEMVTPEENYLAARPAYETVVAAIEFMDPGDIDARRWPLLLASSRFISGRTPEHYQAAMTAVDGRMERLYVPAGNGADGDDQERGVRRIFCWRGMRGEIDPDKPRAAFGEVEQEVGYIVMVAGRYFDRAEDPQTGEMELTIADFSRRYWMSDDRQREAWVNEMLIQTPLYHRPVPFTEVGARDGNALSVWTKPAGEAERVTKPVFESQGYISQVEYYLFADMLAAAGIQTDFGYYAWQTGASTCRFIHDAVLPEADGLAWTILRTIGDGEEVHTFAFDAENRWRGTLTEAGPLLIRAEPTDADRIVQLWEAKGLPTENLRDPGDRRPDRP